MKHFIIRYMFYFGLIILPGCSCFHSHEQAILSHIMTSQEYEAIEHERPYYYKLTDGKASLFYMGPGHTCDPDSANWPIFKKFWNEFLIETKGKKQILLVEGGADTLLRRDDFLKLVRSGKEAEIIARWGEMGLAVFLAWQNGIKSFSPEPNFRYEISELAKSFSKEEIVYAYFARQIPQWHRQRFLDKGGIEAYMRERMASFSRQSGWTEFNCPLETIALFHEKKFKTKMNLYDNDFFRTIANPICDDSFVNRILRESSLIRDKYIVTQIYKYWKNGTSMFAVYGYSHVVMQEPALRYMVYGKCCDNYVD